MDTIHGRMREAEEQNEVLRASIAKLELERDRLREQHTFIVKECEASSSQSKRIIRIKRRAEAALENRDVKFSGIDDRRADKVRHIQQQSYLLDKSTKENKKLKEKLNLVREALVFATKPLCMCFAGCEECHPDPAPPTLEEALALLQKDATESTCNEHICT